jgi:predicted O-methyltransferase YrrM
VPAVIGSRAPRKLKTDGVRLTARDTVDRGIMLAAAQRLKGRDHASRAVAAALSSTALGRFGVEDREWIRRVHSRVWHAYSIYAGVHPVWGRFLMQLVRRLAPASCIELGTAWGVSGAYHAAALELNEAGTLVTFDKGPEWAREAETVFLELGLNRVDYCVGLLDDTLEPELSRIGTVDYAYVDADHEFEPNMRYFETMLPHLSPGAVVVFDDINLSSEMRRTWWAIREHEQVATSIGLRRMGVAIVSGSGPVTERG